MVESSTAELLRIGNQFLFAKLFCSWQYSYRVLKIFSALWRDEQTSGMFNLFQGEEKKEILHSL